MSKCPEDPRLTESVSFFFIIWWKEIMHAKSETCLKWNFLSVPCPTALAGFTTLRYLFVLLIISYQSGNSVNFLVNLPGHQSQNFFFLRQK